MNARGLSSYKLLAVLLLTGSVWGGHSAYAYSDTTPYGIVFASGSCDGAYSGGVKQKVSLFFFRPFTGPATSSFTTGWLPGSVSIKNPDGSTVIDMNDFNPVTVWFPNISWATGPVLTSIMIGKVNYKGISTYMVIAIYGSEYTSVFPTGTGIAIYALDPTDYSKYLFMTQGSLTAQGVVITDP